MKKIKESDIQSSIVEYARVKGINDYLVFVPNEQIIFSSQSGLTKKQKMGWWIKLKKMGLRKGVSDLFFALPKGDYHGLWLEIKCSPNKPTQNQLDFLTSMMKHNYACDISYTVDQGIIIINKYINLLPNQIFHSMYGF